MQKNSDSMLQPQMYGDQFRNISDLDLVEPNRGLDICRHWIAICWLFDAENVRYMHLPFGNARYSPTILSFLWLMWSVVYVWNKQKQQSKCYTWTESGPKMFRDQTKAMLDWRSPRLGPGPVLTLAKHAAFCYILQGYHHVSKVITGTPG